MSISAVCSNSSFAQSDSTSVMNQWKQDFRQLASALQSGNLAGAQKAFKALQQLQQSNQSGGQSSTGQQAGSGNNPIQNDFATLGQALELMERRPSQISVLPVVDAGGRALGILRLHDVFLGVRR